VNNSKQAGIFGGTFNPPHIGHLLIAKKAKEMFKLDKIVFVPSFHPPHKDAKYVLDPLHRLEMVKLLIQGDPSFILSDYEVKKKGFSYSIDTVKLFVHEFSGTKFYFITGSDAFYYIDTWKDSEKLLSLIEFIVYAREGFAKDRIMHKFRGMKNINWIEDSLIHISSSQIRSRVRAGEDCVEETGAAVWEYIRKNNLYKG